MCIRDRDSRCWDGVAVDGKIYGVPANKELPYAPVWAFTKELVDKYNLDIDSVSDLASLELSLIHICIFRPLVRRGHGVLYIADPQPHGHRKSAGLPGQYGGRLSVRRALPAQP